MPEGSETLVSVPLLDQAASQIKETGSFQKNLTDKELESIMQSVINGLVTGQEKVKASVLSTQVKIERQQGTVAGSVSVEKPIKATINLRCTLGNDTAGDRLRLVGLDVKEEAGFGAKMLLRAANIKGKAEDKLRDPNQALFVALGSQLETKGVRLTGIGLHFQENSLAVTLKGQPVTTK